MNDDDVRRLDETLSPTVDLQGSLRDFKEETGKEGIDDFLSWLLANNTIDESDYVAAHATGLVETPEQEGPVDQTLRPYLELGSIGKGGMAEIRLAKDNKLLRKVAIKILKKSQAQTPEVMQRLIREAQVTAQLDHPNIVPLYSIEKPETDERGVGLVMKLIKGQTLRLLLHEARTRLEKDPRKRLPDALTLTSRLEVFVKICEAISYAHSKGVVHRDLKPANLMIGDFGEAYVMDWGIAKLRDKPDITGGLEDMLARGETDVYVGSTELGHVIGTPRYMSPEQAQGWPDVDVKSDQFSLGLLLFEMVTLQAARTESSRSLLLRRAEKGEINRVAHVIGGKRIAPELAAIITRCTKADPRQRYPTVAALSGDVRRFLQKDEVSVYPDNLPRRLWRWMSKHRQMTLLLLLGLIIVSASAIIWSLYQQKTAAEDQRRASEAARFRESRLTALAADVAAQSHTIDTLFVRLEDQLTALADEALYLLTEAPENEDALYWLEDFQNVGRAPPDFEESPLYRRPVSIDYPVVKTAPGVLRESVESLVQRLAPLRHHFRQAFLNSADENRGAAAEQVRELLTVFGVPIRWAYIGLEVGVMYSYPGKATYPADYDPRGRPWYRLAQRRDGIFWGTPYLDIHEQGPVIPCARSLHAGDEGFFGVIGIEVTYHDVVRETMYRPDAQGVLESYLLNEHGEIVVRSSQVDYAGPYDTDEPTLDLALYPIADVVHAIQSGPSGVVETRSADSEPLLVVFHRIRSVGWTYVEELDPAVILGDEEDL